MPWLLDSLDQPRYGSECDTQPYTQILTQDGIKGRIWFWLIVSCKFYYKKVIPMYFMQIYFHVLWSGNKFTDFFVFPNFLLTLHTTWTIKEKKSWEDSKLNLKAKKLNLTVSSNLLCFNFTKLR